MYRSRFYVDGVEITLTPGKWFVRRIQQLHGPDEINTVSMRLPDRDGVVPVPSVRTVGAAKWVAAVTVLGGTYTQMLTHKAELEALLSPPRRLVSLREDLRDQAGGVATALSADATLTAATMTAPWEGPDAGAELEYTFEVPAGKWVEPETTVSITGTGVQQLQQLAGGSAPQTGQTITFTPSGTTVNLRLEAPSHPAAWVQLVGQVTDGVPVSIDTIRLTATQDGTPRTGLLDFGPDQWFIAPDGRVNIASAAGVTGLQITSRKAWY